MCSDFGSGIYMGVEDYWDDYYKGEFIFGLF